jgi:hydrogenase-4 component F
VSFAVALVLLPFAAAAGLALVRNQVLAAQLNLLAAGAGFVLALPLLWAPRAVDGLLHLDALNLVLLLLGAFIGLTTAAFSAETFAQERFVPLAERSVRPAAARQYHVAFQAFLGAHHLALLADNLGVMWVAIEIATIATVLMVALPRTPAAIEAAWKFFILCGVGIALALFGTIVLALAAQNVHGGREQALSATVLAATAPALDGGLLSLGFVFLLVGYGTKAGLVPLHSWLPDAHAEGPTAISAVLSGLLLNLAMHAVLRAMLVVGGHPDAVPPGPFLLGLGLASALLAGFALWRRRDARRLFAWSSIEHMGLAAFAFGLGGGAAYAGVLHLAGHSLLKSAVFFGLGAAVQLKGSQRMADIRGLAASHPALGWALVLAVLAVAGLPPFALFASELRLLGEAAARAPWLAGPLALALLLAAMALVGALQALCFGPPTPDLPGARLARFGVLLPMGVHLAAALVLGLALPAPLAALFAEAAAMLQ